MSLFDCTIVGDVLVDVIAKFDKNPKQLIEGGTTYCLLAKPVLGGAGNVAAGLSQLGGKVAFVGKAGTDYFGNLFIKDLKKRGITTKITREKQVSTGLDIIFTDGKQRSFLVYRGANDLLSTREIEEERTLLAESKYVYFCGYSLVNDPQKSAILRGIELSKELGTKVAFDPGAYNIVNSERKLFQKIVSLSDVLLPNLAEALALTETTNLDDAVEKLQQNNLLTALKCGDEGSVFITERGVFRVPCAKGKCVDTTGAGDAFNAAVIHGLVRKMPIKRIGRLANWFAGQVVTKVGARTFPSRSRIDKFLNELS